ATRARSSRSRRSASSRPASGTGVTSPPSRRPSPRSAPTASSPARRIDRDGDDLLPWCRLQAEGGLSGGGVHDEGVAELVLGLAQLPHERQKGPRPPRDAEGDGADADQPAPGGPGEVVDD